jgi:hypothetical protein
MVLSNPDNYGVLHQGMDHLDTPRRLEFGNKYRNFLTELIVKDKMKIYRPYVSLIICNIIVMENMFWSPILP